MNGKKIYIYGLCDPESGLIRYIGKSIRPNERLTNHMNDQGTCHRTNWLRSLKSKGLKPNLVILQELPDDAIWQDAEKAWIAYGRSQGWPLVNNTSGGDGVCGLPEETRRRISQVWVGRKHSDETKAKIGAASRLKKMPEEAKRRISESQKGRKITWADKLHLAVRKFTEQQVEEISRRLDSGELVKDLAEEYGVHRTTISKIKTGTYLEQKRYGKRAEEESA